MTDFKKPFSFNTMYNRDKVVAKFAYYENGNKAIQLFALNHVPIMKLTVNPPGVILAPDEIAIKNYAENQEAEPAAIDAGLVQAFARYHIVSGEISIPVYRLTPEALAMWKE